MFANFLNRKAGQPAWWLISLGMAGLSIACGFLYYAHSQRASIYAQEARLVDLKMAVGLPAEMATWFLSTFNVDSYSSTPEDSELDNKSPIPLEDELSRQLGSAAESVQLLHLGHSGLGIKPLERAYPTGFTKLLDNWNELSEIGADLVMQIHDISDARDEFSILSASLSHTSILVGELNAMIGSGSTRFSRAYVRTSSALSVDSIRLEDQIRVWISATIMTQNKPIVTAFKETEKFSAQLTSLKTSAQYLLNGNKRRSIEKAPNVSVEEIMRGYLEQINNIEEIVNNEDFLNNARLALLSIHNNIFQARALGMSMRADIETIQDDLGIRQSQWFWVSTIGWICVLIFFAILFGGLLYLGRQFSRKETLTETASLPPGSMDKFLVPMKEIFPEVSLHPDSASIDDDISDLIELMTHKLSQLNRAEATLTEFSNHHADIKSMEENIKGLKSVCREQLLSNSAITAESAAMNALLKEWRERLIEICIKSEQSRKKSAEGMDVAKAVRDLSEKSREHMSVFRQQTSDLLGKMNSLLPIVEQIKDLSEKSNTLALNSTIQLGISDGVSKSFLLATDEIQRLAVDINASTDRTMAGMSLMFSSIEEIGSSVEDHIQEYGAVNEQVNNLGDTFDYLNNSCTQMRDMIDVVCDGIQQQFSLVGDNDDLSKSRLESIDTARNYLGDLEKSFKVINVLILQAIRFASEGPDALLKLESKSGNESVADEEAEPELQSGDEGYENAALVVESTSLATGSLPDSDTDLENVQDNVEPQMDDRVDQEIERILDKAGSQSEALESADEEVATTDVVEDVVEVEAAKAFDAEPGALEVEVDASAEVADQAREPIVDEVSVDEVSVDEVSIDEASVDEASVDEVSVDEASIDVVEDVAEVEAAKAFDAEPGALEVEVDASAEVEDRAGEPLDASVDEVSVDEASVDEASVDEASVDEASVDEVSVDVVEDVAEVEAAKAFDAEPGALEVEVDASAEVEDRAGEPLDASVDEVSVDEVSVDEVSAPEATTIDASVDVVEDVAEVEAAKAFDAEPGALDAEAVLSKPEQEVEPSAEVADQAREPIAASVDEVSIDEVSAPETTTDVVEVEAAKAFDAEPGALEVEAVLSKPEQEVEPSAAVADQAGEPIVASVDEVSIDGVTADATTDVVEDAVEVEAAKAEGSEPSALEVEAVLSKPEQEVDASAAVADQAGEPIAASIDEATTDATTTDVVEVESAKAAVETEPGALDAEVDASAEVADQAREPIAASVDEVSAPEASVDEATTDATTTDATTTDAVEVDAATALDAESGALEAEAVLSKPEQEVDASAEVSPEVVETKEQEAGSAHTDATRTDQTQIDSSPDASVSASTDQAEVLDSGIIKEDIIDDAQNLEITQVIAEEEMYHILAPWVGPPVAPEINLENEQTDEILLREAQEKVLAQAQIPPAPPEPAGNTPNTNAQDIGSQASAVAPSDPEKANADNIKHSESSAVDSDYTHAPDQIVNQAATNDSATGTQPASEKNRTDQNS